MTVVAFSVARFTPSDLAVFNTIAKPGLKRGLWQAVARESGRGYDRLIVLFPGIDRPVFAFERVQDGTYHLWFNDRQGWHGIASGATAAECLAIWRPPAPRALVQG